MKYLPVIFLFIISCQRQQSLRFEYIKNTNGTLIEKRYYGQLLISEITYLKDSVVREGQAKFYKNGKLSKSLNYTDGNLVGSHLEYYDNGQVSLYVCHDWYGDTIFLRRYDTSGKISFESGEIAAQGITILNELEKNTL